MSPADRVRAPLCAILVGLLLVGLLPAVALAAAPDAVDDPSLSVSEDASATSLDVLANDSDPDSDPMSIVDATDPAHGATSTDGSTVSYTPDPDYAGIDTFEYTIDDGNLGTDTATVTVTVDPINDAPSGADGTASTPEDTPHVFASSDFAFSDPNDSPADSLLAVTVTTIPGPGVLTNDGAVMSDGESVSATDIDAGKLVFTPAGNANGAAYSSFTFQVRDDGGGADLDPTPDTITIDVNGVNDPPAGTDATIGVVENGSHTFSTADFGFIDPNDSPENSLLAVKITTPPSVGSMTDNGTPVVADDVVPVADITGNLLVFTPVASAIGSPYATFAFQVQDDGGGADLDLSPRTITIDVTPINHAPAGTDKTITTLEDVPYTLVMADFGFTDPDDSPANTPLAVKITTLATAGSLKNNNVDVSAGQFVSFADITAGSLTFTPAANAGGSPTFTFQVQDDGGTGSGGIDLDPSPNRITIDITARNDAPDGADTTVSLAEDSSYTLLGSDFGFTDTDDSPSSAPLAVTITTLPGAGSLAVGPTMPRAPVVAGQSIPWAEIIADKLVYTPAANGNGSPYATFTFQVQDDGGKANGGVDLDPIPDTITIDVAPVQDTPDARTDASLTVPESAAATSLAVLANDVDPDGDTLTIISTSTASHGTVAITGGGTGLTYDPVQLYYGTDVFNYTISDGHGGTDTATVLLTVVKDTTAPAVAGPAEAFFGQTVGTSTTKARISWSGSDAGTGIARYQLQVSVNRGTYTTITLASATSTSISQTLTDGRSYRYRVRATDRQGNVSGYAYGPTFKPGRLQNTSTSVRYTGKWVTSSASGALGGSARYASSLSARATLSGTVLDVAWVATKTPTAGSAQVWIDGVLEATINLHARSTTYRQLVFSRHFATLASHKIEIRPIGGGPVFLDAFLVMR